MDLEAAGELQRCPWGASPPDYAAYHDLEWGRPVVDDNRLFEKLCLEGFQSGLSWLVILRKRAAFRAAFDGFSFDRIAGYGAADVQRLLADPGIVRHRGKIEAVVHNARRACEIGDRFGSLAAYFWQWEPSPLSRPSAPSWSELSNLSESAESAAMARDLKRLGWRFVGPTTAYSFMQAVGIVNDHTADCFIRAKVESERSVLVRPSPTVLIPTDA